MGEEETSRAILYAINREIESSPVREFNLLDENGGDKNSPVLVNGKPMKVQLHHTVRTVVQ